MSRTIDQTKDFENKDLSNEINLTKRSFSKNFLPDMNSAK